MNVLNKNGETPLIVCVKKGQLDNVEALLKAGADPNFRDNKKRTALHHAVNVANTSADASFEMEELLLKFNADINARDDRLRTPLHYAFVKIGKPFDVTHIDPIETVTSLCGQKNCDANVVDQWGSTPLHYAAQRGSQICAITLKNKHVNIEAKDEDGNTPLAIALKCGHANIAIMLIQSEANVNVEVNIVKKTWGDDKKKKKKDGIVEEKTSPKIKATDFDEEGSEENEEENENENEVEDEDEDEDENEDEEEEEEEDNGFRFNNRKMFKGQTRGGLFANNWNQNNQE